MFGNSNVFLMITTFTIHVDSTPFRIILGIISMDQGTCASPYNDIHWIKLD